MRDDTKKAALSGAASGGLLGLAGSALGGGGIKQALRSALLGALAGGTVSGGGIAIGDTVMGAPEQGEINPYTRRGALGGGIAGAGVGALLGGALAKKYLKIPKATGITQFFANRQPKMAAALGAMGGGLAGAYQAGDEGMQLDFIQNEIDAMGRKRKAEEIAQKIMRGEPI